MTIKIRKWNSAEYLKTDEDMQNYLQACIEESNNDAAFIAKALLDIARANRMTQPSKDTELGLDSLCQTLSSEVNPSFDTIIKVVIALNLRLTIQSL